MNTYEIIYLENDEKKQVRIYAKNEAEAGKAFKQKYPEIKNTNAILSVERIDKNSNDYGVARFATGFIIFFGWIAVLIGAGLLFLGVKEFGGHPNQMALGLIMTLIPAFSFLVGGFSMLVFGQTSLAVLDNTNYSKQMLIEMRRSKDMA